MSKKRLLARREALEGYAFISPWLIGFLVFTLGPMAYSLYLSFTRYDPRGLAGPRWIGLNNYTFALTNTDGKFYASIVTTLTYALISIPIMLAGSLLIALLMNQEVKGIRLFRAIFYLPSVLPAISIGMVFFWLFNTDFGLINYFLVKGLHLPKVDWLGNKHMVLPSYILASLWTIGGGMMVLIAGLKGIPQSLYEAATLDGAGWWSRFWHVTMPQLSFVLFFNLIMGIIGAFQVFDIVFVMGGAGTGKLFYLLYLYQSAWLNHMMGYASALAWILFAIIFAISLVVIKSSPLWVYYEGEKR